MISPSVRMATLWEMKNVYGVEDLYDMLEVIRVDGHNRQRWAKIMARQQREHSK